MGTMSEEPIYNSTGWVIGWIVGNIIYDWSGQGRAFIEGSNIFAPEAEYLGEFSDGFFRDHAGDAVAFIEGARSGPSLPATRQPSPELPRVAESTSRAHIFLAIWAALRFSAMV